MKLGWLSLILALAVAIPALAHGNKKHVMGTLEKVSAESVTVKTVKGKSVEVKLTPKTMYVTKDEKPAKFSDLAVGQRVVIHATPKGEELIADQVKFAATTAAAGAHP